MINLNSYKENSRQGSTLRFKQESLEIIDRLKANKITRNEAFEELYPICGNVIEFVINNNFKTFRNKDIAEDLYAAGLHGFVIAIDRFDPSKSKNASFFSYAKFWVFKYIYAEANPYVEQSNFFDGNDFIEDDHTEDKYENFTNELYAAIHDYNVVNFDENIHHFNLCLDISHDYSLGSNINAIARKYDLTSGFVKRVVQGRGKLQSFYEELLRFLKSTEEPKDFTIFFKTSGFIYIKKPRCRK